MPAPLAKGLIITASILVAAGIALYESPQVRQWVDTGRRKIAHAIQTLGDPHAAEAEELRERRPRARGNDRDSMFSVTEEEEQEQEKRRQWRDDIMRRNRAEMIRKAREEGVSVDLDELAQIGRDHESKKAERKPRADRSRSFDEMVGSDGMLISRSIIDEKDGFGAKASGAAIGDGNAHGGLKHRGTASSAKKEKAGKVAGSKFANPFDDEAGGILFDASAEEDTAQKSPRATSPEEEQLKSAPNDSSSLVVKQPPTHMDLHSSQPTVFSSSSNATSPHPIDSSQHSLLDQSFHSFASSHSHAPSSPSLQSAGTMTPTEEENPHHQLDQSLDSSFSVLETETEAQPHELEATNLPSAATTPATSGSTLPTISAPSSPPPQQHSLHLHPPPNLHHNAQNTNNTSELGDEDHLDARSEGFAESEFSFVSDGGPGLGGRSTPGSWTDVGSDDGFDDHEGGAVHNGAGH